MFEIGEWSEDRFLKAGVVWGAGSGFQAGRLSEPLSPPRVNL